MSATSSISAKFQLSKHETFLYIYIYIYTLGPVSFVSRRRSKLIGRANLASRLLLNSFWNTDHDGKDRIINLITRLNYGESTMGEDPVNQEN